MKVISYIEKDPVSGMYIGIVPSIPGAHTQAKTLDALNKNLKEVIELCMEELSSAEALRSPSIQFRRRNYSGRAERK